jgi:hypothetical protein
MPKKLIFQALVVFSALALSCGNEKGVPEIAEAPATESAIEVEQIPAEEARTASEESGTLPLTASLGTMLYTPRGNWRYGEYELFAFNRFPDIIYLFSTSNAVQSLFLRRLAFFVEKRGFTGRLAHDEEIQDLRDWGAHDYKGADLARFFQKAAEENFPLNSHELLLKEILLANGIIRQDGSAITAGKGALIGMSAEFSVDRLSYYLVHETIHGLCFTIPELQEAFASFYHSLSDIEKDYLKSAFDYREYNVLADEALLITETAAYLLQQPPVDTPAYFERTISYWFAHSQSARKGEWADFLKADPKIFERQSAFLQQKLLEITALGKETFFDLPKDSAL